MYVKPYIVLLFIITVFTILLVISVIFPPDGLLLYGSVRLKFARPEEIFLNKDVKYADITNIIKNEAFINDTTLENLAKVEPVELKDTIKSEEDSLGRAIRFLEFSKDNHSMLYPVFKALDKASSGSKPVRIIHYGDSQIEGDRITSYLRNRLQQKFGGMGVGLVPVEQVYDFKFSINQKNSGRWHRYTLYGERDTTLHHKYFGALASFCRFSSHKTDTAAFKTANFEASVSFEPSAFAYQNTKTFQQCRVFYAHNREPFLAEIYQGGTLADADMYPKSGTLNIIQWTFEKPVSRIKITFKGPDSPDLYGIALDGLNGVAVDNIAMRGNAGLVFTKMDAQFLKEHFQKLNVKLIILQYGGNVVPHIVNKYTYYENLFYAQLMQIKELLPDVGIIVIGVADMSIKEKDGYVSYPNIEKVRDALKNATMRADASYWDMFEAMGGRNSMPSWVFANPPLASSDFVHFNVRGSKIIAQMFYNSLIYEYNLYKKNTGVKEEAN
jgi:hypothetical protein